MSENAPQAVLVQLVLNPKDVAGSSESRYARLCYERRRLLRDIFSLTDAGPLFSHEPSIVVRGETDIARLMESAEKYKSLILSIADISDAAHLPEVFHDPEPKKKKHRKHRGERGVGAGIGVDDDDIDVSRRRHDVDDD